MARKISVEIVGDSASLERAFRRSSSSAKHFNRDIERTGRGALAAGLSFRGLGRSVTFASAQFLGGAGIVFALKSTIQAAEESQRVVGQTRNAVERSGQSWARWGKQIKAVALAQANLSGFDDERLLGTFSTLVRRTGDVTKALKLNALAADVARGRNISLEAATMITLKASMGQAGALRRAGIAASKHATALQLLDLLQRKYAGSAAAYGKTAAGAQDRFGVALQNTQEIIGSALLPMITQYLNQGAKWLSNTENQERVQRDVTETVRIGSKVAHEFAAAAKAAADGVGGFKHLLELLLALKVATTLSGWAGGFARLGSAAGMAGAAGEVGVLQGSLLTLANGGPYIATLIIAKKTIDDPKGQIGGRAKAVLAHADELRNLPTVGPLFGAAATVLNGLANQKRHAAERRKDLQTIGPVSAADTNRAAERGVVNSPVTRGPNLSVGGRTRPDKADVAKAKISADDRNKWFDAMIGRKIDRVQDIQSVSKQIAALNSITGLIQQRIAKTKDITRRLNLEDQLVSVRRQKKGLLDQIAEDQRKKALDAKQKAAEIKRHAKEIAADAKRASKEIVDTAKRMALDAADAQRQAFGALFSGPILNPSEQDRKRMLGVPGVSADKLLKDITAQNQRFASMQRMLGRLRKRGASGALIGELSAQGVEGLPQISALAKAPKGVLQAFFNQARIRDRQVNRAAAVEQKITINIHGGDEKKVAQEVLRILQKRGGKSVAQTRGRYGGKNLGLH